MQGKSEKDIAEEYFSQWVVHRRSFAAYRNLIREKRIRTNLRVLLLIGDTGVGKTRYVHERAGSDLWSSVSRNLEWFDGYSGEGHVLFDDFRGGPEFDFLLRLLDVYPISVPVKGSFVEWEPSTIWITSNWEIDRWYPSVDLSPLQRRISRIVRITRGLGEVDWSELKTWLDAQFE